MNTILSEPTITERLEIGPLTEDHVLFIRRLVNTEGWLRFIGNRNVGSVEDSLAYIRKILSNEKVRYWVVALRASGEPIGVVTLIKRDYLDHHDIGFAFLPEVSGYGYAYEAALVLLSEIAKHEEHNYLLATTIPDNTSSIRLLKKLGLHFEKEIDVDELHLHIYSKCLKAEPNTD